MATMAIREPPDMPTEQITREFAALERLKQRLPRGELRTSCEIAELHLQQHKLDFAERYENEARRIRRSMCETVSKERFDRDHVHPRLIINGRPVLELFLYGIRIRTGKSAIVRFLSDHGFENVEIVKVYVTKSTSATLRVRELGSSFLLQVKSCLNQMWWQYRNGEPSVIRVIPSLFDMRRNPRVEPLVVPPLPAPVTRAVLCHEIVDKIASHLDTADIMNFYRAVDFPPSFAGLKIDFDAAIDRYSGAGAHSRMFEDASRFRFTAARFNSEHIELETSAILKVLRTQVERNPELAVCLDCLDLTAVDLTVDVIKYVSESIKVKSLGIGPVRDIFDHYLRVDKIEMLMVRDNCFYRAGSLEAPCFANLHTLKIINCKKVLVKPICAFISSSKGRRSLDFDDCSYVDKDQHISQILATVFNGESRIEYFSFAYSEPQDIPTGNGYRFPEIKEARELKHLRLSFNPYAEDIMEIVRNAPKLELLQIHGVKVPSNFHLDHCIWTISVSIDYYPQINDLLLNLSARGVNYFDLVNRLGKSKTKAIDRQFIFNVMQRHQRYCIRLRKCQIWLSDFSRRRMRENGAEIIELNDELVIKRER